MILNWRKIMQSDTPQPPQPQQTPVPDWMRQTLPTPRPPAQQTPAPTVQVQPPRAATSLRPGMPIPGTAGMVVPQRAAQPVYGPPAPAASPYNFDEQRATRARPQPPSTGQPQYLIGGRNGPMMDSDVKPNTDATRRWVMSGYDPRLMPDYMYPQVAAIARIPESVRITAYDSDYPFNRRPAAQGQTASAGNGAGYGGYGRSYGGGGGYSRSAGGQKSNWYNALTNWNFGA